MKPPLPILDIALLSVGSESLLVKSRWASTEHGALPEPPVSLILNPDPPLSLLGVLRLLTQRIFINLH